MGVGKFIHAVSMEDFVGFNIRQEIVVATNSDGDTKKLKVKLNIMNNNIRFVVSEKEEVKIITNDLEEAIEVYNSILI